MRCAYSEPICPRCERIGSCEIYSALREAREHSADLASCEGTALDQLKEAREERDFVIAWHEACEKANAEEMAGITDAQHEALDILLADIRERAETAERERDLAREEVARLRTENEELRRKIATYEGAFL